MKQFLLLLLLPASALTARAQSVTPLWQDFVSAKHTGKTPVLPDFSYAGYHFSEKALPDLRGKKQFNVTDYGAKPDDDVFDDEAIQKAIDAAEANPGGGVVFFAPGRFLIAPDSNNKKQIRISKSGIVLKGSGAETGGTVIHQVTMRINGRQFLFRPEDTPSPALAILSKDAGRETFTVEVQDAGKLKTGQDVVLRHRSEAFTRLYFAPLDLKPQWTRLFGEKGGMQIFEIHTIQKIEGNRVTFRNPLHLDVRLVPGANWELVPYTALEEVGIEDIRFTSNWKNYPEEFIHHKNEIHDYAYEAVGMEFVKNSWVRNCVFEDWNEGIFIRSGYGVTVTNTHFRGKKGHASVHARTGYGVLVKNCSFNGAQHHGAGTGYSAVGTVITQCSLGTDQNFDIHSGQPYATLYDDIKGGVFYNLGGPEPGHPHHGKYLVLWNFQHSSAKEQHYNFWDMSRRRNYTIAAPLMVGFRSDNPVTFENYQVNEEQGKEVMPRSLFEAQLALRLTGKDIASPKSK
ncbi:DUF4955 domain-containing protein [Flaviaesturariibacter flavus]|uniref:DUF4955 domain-containing protein n=1 Tax=Flaviaesturariibacter flavus TaxID=2502780 RepID=A0A4R1BQX7_9BACT|nr:DUF4955 domain-containing protein [Flaviaesturariibacter flavus]TCJ19575.1 DUF4955 domain-containing protein [Flaviaesturariibacter flavus]